MTYRTMNPSMSLCPIYCNHSVVPEFARLAVTIPLKNLPLGRAAWEPRCRLPKPVCQSGQHVSDQGGRSNMEIMFELSTNQNDSVNVCKF